jgi:hypothetical protein
VFIDPMDFDDSFGGALNDSLTSVTDSRSGFRLRCRAQERLRGLISLIFIRRRRLLLRKE